jgi:uncharacterized membrane protein YqiK
MHRMGIVFTRAYGDIEPQQDRRIVDKVVSVLAKHTGLPVAHLPFWQIDSKVGSRRGVTADFIVERTGEVKRAVEQCLQWARVQTPMETHNFKLGEYAETRELREAREAAARASALAKAAEEAALLAERHARAEAAARAEAERARAAAEQRALEAQRRSKETYFSLTKGFKINGRRIW